MSTNVPTSSSHPFIQAMVPEHRAVIVQGAGERALAQGEILFREGYPANRLFLIHEGSVALETRVPGKGDVLIATVGPGQVLGWSWLVAPFVWNFQGRALEETKVTELDGGHLLVACEQNHYLGYELMKAISKVVLEVLLVAHQRWVETGRRSLVKPGALAALEGAELNAPVETRLAQHPFFHSMRADYLEILGQLAQPRQFEEGHSVLRAGEFADGLYLVERGTLIVEAPGTPEAIPVKVIGAGDALGWSSFWPPYEWNFDCRALQLSSALFFDAADLRERCAGNYHLGYELTKRITRMMLQHLYSTRQRMWEAHR